jgi:hypothetical protein
VYLCVIIRQSAFSSNAYQPHRNCRHRQEAKGRREQPMQVAGFMFKVIGKGTVQIKQKCKNTGRRWPALYIYLSIYSLIPAFQYFV